MASLPIPKKNFDEAAIYIGDVGMESFQSVAPHGLGLHLAMPDPETPRLLFRKCIPADLQDLFAIRTDPDVMRYIGAGRPESVAEVESILNKILKHWEQHEFGPWALID